MSKGKIVIITSLVLLALVSIIVILSIVWGVSFLSLGKFNILGDQEEQLKSNYITDFSDQSDGNPTSIDSVTYTEDGESIILIEGQTYTLKRDYKEQEVVVLVSGSGTLFFNTGVTPGYCVINPGEITLTCPEVTSKYGIVSCEEKTVRYIPNPLNTDEYLINVNGLDYDVISFSGELKPSVSCYKNPQFPKGTMEGYLKYVGYKAQLSCELKQDEVWVTESFAQDFTIKDLEFYPAITKLCDESHPMTVRDLETGNDDDVPKRFGIDRLNNGQLIEVDSGKIVTVVYGTPNVQGVTNPCDVDESNVKVNGIWVCKQLITDADSVDREFPERERIIIDSENDFSFSSNDQVDSFNIGNQNFKVIKNNYDSNCVLPEEASYFTPPYPKSECYSSDFKFGNQNYNIEDGEEKLIHEKIHVTYYSSGKIRMNDGQLKNELNGLFMFSVNDALDIDFQVDTSIEFNKPSKIKVIITNNLPSNDVILKVQQRVDRTQTNLIDKEYDLFALGGQENTYEVDINTENLGLNSITLQALYPIQTSSNVLISSNKIKLNVDINEEGESVINIVEESFLSKIWGWFMSLFGIR